jgi:hypothetical protein
VALVGKTRARARRENEQACPPPLAGEEASEAMPEGASVPRLRKRYGRRPPPYPPPHAGEGKMRMRKEFTCPNAIIPAG